MRGFVHRVTGIYVSAKGHFMLYYWPMPIIAQAAKKMRHDRKRTIQTVAVRKTLRALIKSARKSPSQKTLTKVFQALDKAAKRNIIHKNKAARIKSALSKLLPKKSPSKKK